jgi:hypothetical protein
MTQLPIMWPSQADVTVAAELGVVALLDAALAMTVPYLLIQNPELADHGGANGRGVPPPDARVTARILADIHDLRAKLRRYQHLTCVSDLAPSRAPPF